MITTLALMIVIGLAVVVPLALALGRLVERKPDND